MKTKLNLEWYCRDCGKDTEFKHISSDTKIVGRPEQHYYTCVKGCGTTYEQKQLLSLRNVRKIYEHVTA